MFDAYYSDPHFGHANIIEFAGRPFSSLEDMHEEFILRYNATVMPDQLCLWVGDCFFMRAEPAREILLRLNGKKVLVRGNHDHGNTKHLCNLGFEMVVYEMKLKIAGRYVRVSHYPYWMQRGHNDDRFRTRRPTQHHRELLMHGHTHNRAKVLGSMLHVGVDAWDYYPATRAEIERLVQQTYRRVYETGTMPAEPPSEEGTEEA